MASEAILAKDKDKALARYSEFNPSDLGQILKDTWLIVLHAGTKKDSLDKLSDLIDSDPNSVRVYDVLPSGGGNYVPN
jgi:hypothetical protein